MPQMYNANARNVLMKALDRLKSVTNESVGIIYSWNGALTVLGCEPFRHYVSDRKEEIWHSLAHTPTADYTVSKAGVDNSR